MRFSDLPEESRHRPPPGTPPFAQRACLGACLGALLRWLLRLVVAPEKGAATPCATGSRPYLKTLSAERWGLGYESTHGQTAVSREPMGDHPLRARQQRAHVPALPHLGRTDHFVCAGRCNCCPWRPWRCTCCHACTVLVSPVLPIGAEVLRGEMMPGTEDGPDPVLAGVAIGAA